MGLLESSSSTERNLFFSPLGLSLVPENHRAIGQKVGVGVVTVEKPGCWPVLFEVVEKLRTKLVQ